MDTVVDQILNKLLSERERSFALENALTTCRQELMRVRDLVDATDSDTVNEVSNYVKSAERVRGQLSEFTRIDLAAIQTAVLRAIAVTGLTPTNDLRADCENLAKILETSRAPNSIIL
jgi:hypothetical protein